MASLIKIKSSDIREGMRFSAPVFFDDGKNMFLAEGKTAKPYHITALKRWAIPYLVTYGHEITDNDTSAAAQEGETLEELDDLEPLDTAEDAGEDVTSMFVGSGTKSHIA